MGQNYLFVLTQSDTRSATQLISQSLLLKNWRNQLLAQSITGTINLSKFFANSYLLKLPDDSFLIFTM